MRVIIFVIRFISRFGRFPEDFLRERLPCTGVLYASPFYSLSLSLSLYHSLSLISPSLSVSLDPSNFPSLSLLLSLFSLSFSLAYLVYVKYCTVLGQYGDLELYSLLKKVIAKLRTIFLFFTSNKHFYVKYCSVLTQNKKIDFNFAITSLSKKMYF